MNRENSLSNSEEPMLRLYLSTAPILACVLGTAALVNAGNGEEKEITLYQVCHALGP
jgi:hypothetical protein